MDQEHNIIKTENPYTDEIGNAASYLMMSCGFRGGAALTSSILNSHSKISFSMDKIKYWTYCFSRYSDLNKTSIKTMLDELRFRLYSRFTVEFDVEDCLNKIGDNFTHSFVYQVVLGHILLSETRSRIIGECENLSWTKIPYFLEHIPDGKALMIIRDPRDVLVSFKKHTIAPGYDYLVAVFNCLDMMEKWRSYNKLYGERFMGILFEELKIDMQGVTENICNFIGVEFELTMLNQEYWKMLGAGGWVPWENHEGSSFSENKELKKNPVGRWRSIIDPVDHYICEWIAGGMMKKFGYELEFKDPTLKQFDSAVGRMMSSDVVKGCFFEYIQSGRGTEIFPLNPHDPKNWEMKYVDHPDMLKDKGQ